MNTIGFTKKEAEYFGSIVAQMMRSKEERKAMKPKKNKKPPKMKRAELLKRLLGFLEHGVIAVSEESQNWINEWLLLKEELRRVVK